ncbi:MULTISPECIES: hypothetical protein [unclassified Actinobaculum]|uniref:hypothetical protein n=1 Tax=unclassified Actinobaculum TaxID=2609299 RepID=UPI000D528102|nr:MULTISPECIES: hypothetical protein [unclassified Actinobaculum]AWE41856.1 hypothetical protein DDD63_02765 [Actinobaculum sp. 313]RTE50225.1 hypothetical protein EKN07_03160 [Actinobaculum sp. 352]
MKREFAVQRSYARRRAQLIGAAILLAAAPLTACSNATDDAETTSSETTIAPNPDSAETRSTTTDTQAAPTETAEPDDGPTAMEISRTDPASGSGVSQFLYSGIGFEMPVETVRDGEPNTDSAPMGVPFYYTEGDTLVAAQPDWFGQKIESVDSMKSHAEDYAERQHNDFTASDITVPGAKEAQLWEWTETVQAGDIDGVDGWSNFEGDVQTKVVAVLGSNGYYYEVTYIYRVGDSAAEKIVSDSIDSIYIDTKYPKK